MDELKIVYNNHLKGRIKGGGSAYTVTTFVEYYLIVEFMKNRTVCFRIIIEHLFYNFEHFQKILLRFRSNLFFRNNFLADSEYPLTRVVMVRVSARVKIG